MFDWHVFFQSFCFLTFLLVFVLLIAVGIAMCKLNNMWGLACILAGIAFSSGLLASWR